MHTLSAQLGGKTYFKTSVKSVILTHRNVPNCQPENTDLLGGMPQMSPSEHAMETHVQIVEHRILPEVSWCINSGRPDLEISHSTLLKTWGVGWGEKTHLS